MGFIFSYRNGSIKEFTSKKHALESKINENVQKPESLFQEKKTKKLADLIYGSDDDNDSEDDMFINQLDTSNPNFKSKKPRGFISKPSVSNDLVSSSIRSQIGSPEIDNTTLIRKIYRFLVKPKFVTGNKELAEMQKLPEDEDGKMQLNQNDSESESENDQEDDKFIKPHLRNLPTKEELIALEKRRNFTGENYGYFK